MLQKSQGSPGPWGLLESRLPPPRGGCTLEAGPGLPSCPGSPYSSQEGSPEEVLLKG